jgi:hypothetical protein
MTSLKYLLDEGRIEAVEPDVDAAKNKLEEAKRHLASAAAIADDDPEGAYSLVYDAARKAADAHMLANGYRASKSKVGAHEATARYVEAWREVRVRRARLQPNAKAAESHRIRELAHFIFDPRNG